jgi:hypothetical protein
VPPHRVGSETSATTAPAGSVAPTVQSNSSYRACAVGFNIQAIARGPRKNEGYAERRARRGVRGIDVLNEDASGGPQCLGTTVGYGEVGPAEQA